MNALPTPYTCLSLRSKKQQLQFFFLSSMSNIIFFLLFHLSLTSIHSLTISPDITGLQSFKSSIKPTTIPPYSCLASWNFTTDPCSLPRITHFTCGLSCTTTNRVTKLTLDPAGYSGTISPLISELTQLTILDLSENNFYGPIPSLSFLTNLQTISLRFNSFSGSVPPSLTSLRSLQSLDLSHNSLSGSLPNSMNSLTMLTRLDLSYNKLTGSLPTLPSNLKELAIKSNSLSGVLYRSSLDGLTQLAVVELSENSLTGTLQSWFFLLPSIQQVNLAHNSFTRVEISKPGNLNSDLVAVNLSFNRIDGTLPINFSDYPMLSSLVLSNNRFRGAIPWQFSKKETLKRLYLDGNFLNGVPPAGFFSGEERFTGSLGDNCLESCPASSRLCLKSQKPTSICRQAYGGKIPRS